MMEQPKMPMLTLDLQKTTTYNTVPLRLTQGDKGYIQPFTLTNAFQQYTVTADVLGFRAMKPDGKYIEIQNEPARFALADGVWEFNLPDELTQAIGTVTGAYFYVQSGTNIVASTTKFNYSISAAWSSDEQSNNYVTKLEELGKKLQDYVNAGAQTVTVLNDYGEEAKATLTKSLTDLTTSVNTWKTTTTTAVDKVLADEKTALQKAQSDWNAEYNKVVAYYANMAVEWTAKKASYDKLAADEIAKMEADKKTVINKFASDSAAKLTAVTNSLADLETKKTAALNKVASDGTAKVAEIQSQADAKLASIQKDWNTLKPKLQAEINALSTKVSGIDDQSNTIKTRLDSLVVQLDSIDIVSVKNTADKAKADVATLTASLAAKADKSQLTQLSDQLTSKMEQVGAPNLVPETFSMTNGTGTLLQTTHPYYQGSRILYQLTNSATKESTAQSKKFSVKPNTTYTLSFKAFASPNVSNSDVWVICAGIDGSSSNDILAIEKKIFSPSHPEYTIVQITTGPNDRSAFVRFDNNGSTDGTSSSLLFAEVQLEEGTVATPYRTAEAQVSSQIVQNVLDIKNLAGRNDSQDVTISKLTKSVNGITPDASGNISLPQPDLTPYVTNSALTLKLASYYDKTTADGRYLPKTTSFATPAQVTAAETNAKNYASSLFAQAPKIRQMTQSAYDSLATKDSNTLYIIVEG